MDLSDLLQECQVVTADQSSVDHLKRLPAVYTFYDALRFDKDQLLDDIVKFKTTHGRVITLKTEEKQGGKFLPEHARLQFRGNPMAFKGTGRDYVKELDDASKVDFARELLFLSLLSEPLYIGKTGNMKKRFGEHHDPNGFLHFMKDTRQRHPGEFILLVYYCRDADYARGLESILLQIVNPAFAGQKS